MNILIAPFSRGAPDVRRNPKDWLWWPVLVEKLREAGHRVVQTGLPEDMRLNADDWMLPADLGALKKTLKDFDLFISVDTWLQHAAACHGLKGIVIWSVTDPGIFGYPENVNLLPADPDLSRNQYAILPGIVDGLSLPASRRPCVSVDAVMAAVETFGDTTGADKA